MWDSGEYVSSPSLKSWKPGSPMVHLNLKTGEDWCFSLNIQASNEFNAFHLHWGKHSDLLSLQMQVLISFRNTFTEQPEIMLNQLSGPSLKQAGWYVRLTIITLLSCVLLSLYFLIAGKFMWKRMAPQSPSGNVIATMLNDPDFNSLVPQPNIPGRN